MKIRIRSQTAIFDKRRGDEGRKETTYCSLAHHFGPHSRRHGHRRSVEEHTPHYDIGTGLYCSAVLKRTEKETKKTSTWRCTLLHFLADSTMIST